MSVESSIVGQTGLEVTRSIVVANPTIEKVRFCRYRYSPSPIPEAKGVHDDHPFWVDRAALVDNSPPLTNELTNLTDGYNIAVSSEVELATGVKGYLPMMDTTIPKSQENLDRLSGTTQSLLVPQFGHMVILETDASYHLMGLSPIPLLEQVIFLGTCVNTKIKGDDGKVRRLADVGFTGYVMEQHGGSPQLRVTANNKKSVPRAVALVR